MSEVQHGFLASLAEASEAILVGWYLGSILPESTPFLAEILRRHAPETDAFRKLIARLRVCHEWRRRLVYGQTVWFRHQCKAVLCPRCSQRRRSVEAFRLWEKLARAAGGTLNRNELSAVTINADRLPLGSDFSTARDRLFGRIRKIRERCLPLSRWACVGEIAHDVSWSGLLHVHGIVHHPGTTREEFRKLLKERFPAKQAIRVKAISEAQSVEDGGQIYLGYAVHKTLLIDPRWSLARSEIPEYLVELIHSYHSIIKRGLMGLRLEIGLRQRKLNYKKLELNSVEGFVIKIELQDVTRGTLASPIREWARVECTR